MKQCSALYIPYNVYEVFSMYAYFLNKLPPEWAYSLVVCELHFLNL